MLRAVILARLEPFSDTLRFAAWREAMPLVGWNIKIIPQILPVVPQASGKRQLLSTSKHVRVRSCWALLRQMIAPGTHQHLQPLEDTNLTVAHAMSADRQCKSPAVPRHRVCASRDSIRPASCASDAASRSASG